VSYSWHACRIRNPVKCAAPGLCGCDCHTAEEWARGLLTRDISDPEDNEKAVSTAEPPMLREQLGNLWKSVNERRNSPTTHDPPPQDIAKGGAE
jgi:hypothetical protein